MMNKVKIIQASLDELKLLFFESASFDVDEIFYIQTLIFYLEGDIDNLNKHINNNSKSNSLLNLLSRIRLAIIKINVDRSELKNLNDILSLENDNQNKVWRAEANFLLGWAYRETNNFEDAKTIFKNAYTLLWEVGAKKKAVKSMLNYVVSDSNIDNNKRYLTDYQMIAKKALEVGDPIVAGLCQLNMAREYRLLSCFELSLKLINESIENLKTDRGANNYYYAVLERCTLLIHLQRFTQAYSDYEIVKESNLKEIVEATKVIKIKLGQKIVIEKSFLDPAWTEVLNQNEHTSDYKLTKFEASLIKYLSFGEKEKGDIIRHIYGENLNFESADNRFKVLLSRLRKKDPKLISYTHGYYKLTEGKVFNDDESQVS